MKNNVFISAVVAAGFIAGATIPALAEPGVMPDIESPDVALVGSSIEPPGPCANFSTEFGPSFGLGNVKNGGTTWSGSIDLTQEQIETEGGYKQLVPQLQVWPIYPEPGEEPCYWTNRIPIDNEWVEKSDGWTATIKPVGAAGIREDGRPAMYFNPDLPAHIDVQPELNVTEYGVYTNINNISVTSPSERQPGYKEIQVAYTLYVFPPTPPGNEFPEVPDYPVGISDGYDFGKVDIFDYKRGVFEITNIGTDDLAVRKATIVDSNGDEAPEFSVTGTTCKDGFIRPGRSCQVQVQFFPRVEGTRAAFIEVATNADFPLQIPLTGVGTYTKPESIVEEEQEAAENGTKPEYEVSEPEKPTVPENSSQEVSKKNGSWVVKTKKKKITVKWKAPDTDQPVTGYEIRKKFKKKSWKKWKDVDPMPNKKGWIKSKVKAKKSGKYKVQVASSTPWVERGDKVTVKIKKKS